MTTTVSDAAPKAAESEASKIANQEQKRAEEIEDSLSYARLCRVLRSENSEMRWRAMYERSGTQWMTLYQKDVNLLISCQAGDAKAYEEKEFVYKPDAQPLVGLSETDGVYNLYSVYLGNRYVTHGEGEKLVTESNKPVVLEKALTIEQVQSQIDNAFKTRKEARKSARPTDLAVFTAEDEKRENAEALIDVSLHVDNQQDKLGKLQMATLWRLRNSGDFRALPSSPQMITDIVRNQQYKNRDYVLSLSMVVDRVFPQVDALLKAGKPFVNPSTGEAVTVETLIIEDGLIKKLTKSSALFEKLLDLDKRRLLIGAIVTKTAEEVAALREELGKISISNVGAEEAAQNGSEEIPVTEDDLITPIVELIPSSREGMPPKHRLVFDDLSDAHFLAIMTILKPMLRDAQQRGSE